jgi:hypothetical protein
VIRQSANFAPEGFVGDGDELTQQEIAFLREPAFSFLDSQS